MAHDYTSLTGELRDPNSPLRQFMYERLPNRRAITADLRPGDHPPLVRSGVRRGPSGTLGAAFEYALRLWFDPHHVPTVALLGAESSDRLIVVRDVLQVAQAAAEDWERSESPPESLLRACWGLALFTEAGRVGFGFVTPLVDLERFGDLTASGVLRILNQEFEDTMRALLSVAADGFSPLRAEPSHVALGPTFAASTLCAADADMIIDGCLWEIKTGIGDRRRERIYIEATDLYQMAGYVLFDTPDFFRIDRIGLYQARFGRVLTWSVEDYFSALASGPVDLKSLRSDLWRLLGGSPWS